MPKIIYYVACSVDGFIAGANGDVSQFIYTGKGIEQYQNDLAQFETVIMGRKTYEFGYNFGLTPGQPAYPQMQHYIFSNSLQFKEQSNNVHVVSLNIENLQTVLSKSTTDIYLCGGGDFAGWLLDNEKIDVMKIKLNPLLLGTGKKLFGSSEKKLKLNLLESIGYDDGLQLLTYDIKY